MTISHVIPITLLLLTLATPAYAAPMRDMSLSPTESLQQPTPAAPAMPTISSGNAYIKPSADIARQAGLIPGTANFAQSFMDGYCNPGYRPVVNGNSLSQSCLAQARQKSCEMYARMPDDARRLISSKIDCAQIESEGTQPRLPNGCDAMDAERIALLKKYWSDQNTAYALLFLPDLTLNASVECMQIKGY